MSNKNLFQEAIADAKAVREAALANAKAALEETMTPRLQSMIAARLAEGDDDLEEVELWNDQDFVSDNGRRQYIKTSAMSEKLDATDTFFTDEEPFEDISGTEKGSPYMEEDLDEELDLEEILAELEEETQLEEAKEKKEDEDEDEDASEEDEDETELDPKDPKFSEKLEKLITKIVTQELEKEEAETSADENAEEMGDMNLGSDETETMDEDFNLDELLAELDEMYGKEEEDMKYERKMSKHEEKETKKQEKEEHASKKEKAEQSEMKEALSVINTLRSELNEVNLLNAKLLYVNKIFKSKSLTESQKVQVITSFDKATTIKEAKVVYESLTTALTAPKKPLKESLGFASRAAGIAPKKQIVESNDAILRMQKLANIIK